MSERPSYIKLILSFEGKAIKMGDWLDAMDASPKIREKLAPFGLVAIKFQENVFYPAIVTDEKGGTRLATFVFDHTDKQVAENFLDWVYAHQDEIKRGESEYLYVEDTKQRRFAHKLDEIGLRDCIIKSVGEKAYPREKMIGALQSMVNAIPSLDIPATITEIRIFGSMVRNKPLVGDIDLLVKYKFTTEQELRLMMLHVRLGEEPEATQYGEAKIWELYEMFKKAGVEAVRKAKDEAVAAAKPEDKEIIGKNYDFFVELSAIIAEGRARKKSLEDMIFNDISPHRKLRDIVADEKPIRELLDSISYPIDWFLDSLTLSALRDYWDKPSFVDVRRILYRALVGKRKGFRLQFGEDEVNEVSILAWSPEHPNVKANIDGRTPEQYMADLIRIFDSLHHDLEHFHEIARSKFNARIEPPPVKPDVDRSGTETAAELEDKISMLREQIKQLRYRYEHAPRDKNDLKIPIKM
jgi:predicted nucleotidyltransferase